MDKLEQIIKNAQDEWDAFYEEVHSLDNNEIFDMANEVAIKQELLFIITNELNDIDVSTYDDIQIKHPLDAFYQEYISSDVTNIVNELRELF